MFTLPEINLIVLQHIQSELKQDFESARINYGLSKEVAETIKSASITNLRDFTLNTATPMFTVSNAKDGKFWSEHATAIKHDISRLDGIVRIRSVLSNLQQAAA
jgi:hypothetical protein